MKRKNQRDFPQNIIFKDKFSEVWNPFSKAEGEKKRCYLFFDGFRPPIPDCAEPNGDGRIPVSRRGRLGSARLCGFGIICRGHSRMTRRIVVARNGLTLLFRKNRGCIRLPPGGRWILRSKRRREPAKVRAYIKSSNLLIESLPPQAPSTTSWSPSLSEGGFFVPKFCAKQKIIPQGCAFGGGRFVNRPYDASRILMEQRYFPKVGF